jgi:hypothetical protein
MSAAIKHRGPSANARAREPDTSREGAPYLGGLCRTWRSMGVCWAFRRFLTPATWRPMEELAVYGEMARSAHVIGLRRASGPQAPSFGGANDPICGISAVRPVRETWAVTMAMGSWFDVDLHVPYATQPWREPDGTSVHPDLAAYGPTAPDLAVYGQVGGLWKTLGFSHVLGP